MIKHKSLHILTSVLGLSLWTLSNSAFATCNASSCSFSGNVSSASANYNPSFTSVPTYTYFSLTSDSTLKFNTSGSNTAGPFLLTANAMNYAGGQISVVTGPLRPNGKPGGFVNMFVADISPTATALNRVTNMLWLTGQPFNFTTATINGTTLFLTTPEQTTLAGKALMSSTPATFASGCVYIYNKGTNQVEQLCNVMTTITSS